MNSALFLGTGGASGIPIIGCRCPTCLSKDSKDKRFRTSLLLRYEGKTLLIDAGPDFRMQALQNGLKTLDGILITHTHYDHVGGLDDLRAICFYTKKAIPALISKSSYEEVRVRYSYFFTPRRDNENYKVSFDFQVIEGKRGTVDFHGTNIGYTSYLQGNMEVFGYRFGDFAYITDIKEYSDTIFSDLKGVKTLVVSASSASKSHVHFTVSEAVAFIQKVGAETGYLVHLSHSLNRKEEEKRLPSHIFFAYDGLQLEF